MSTDLELNRLSLTAGGPWDPDSFSNEEKVILAKPAGLGKVTLSTATFPWDSPRNKTFDFTGMTNEQVLKRMNAYYSHPRVFWRLGDHIFFEGISQSKEDPTHFYVHWGS